MVGDEPLNRTGERKLVLVIEHRLEGGAPAGDIEVDGTLLGRYQSLDGQYAVIVLRLDGRTEVPRAWHYAGGPLPWLAEHIGDPFPECSPPSGALVVVQREHPLPVTREKIRARRLAAGDCLERYRVRPINSCLSLDGRRQLCLFEGPDAESVRQMSRARAEPFTRIWSARVDR